MTISFNKLWLSQSETYAAKVAYFSMEIAVDQSLKTFSGGLGFLAGSHMRSAYDLKQNVIGISILWTHGYYTQSRATGTEMRVDFIDRHYTFLKDTGILFSVTVHGHPVIVRAYLLEPETFGTAPLFFLSTDIPENDWLSRSITQKLYDANEGARVAQSIVLGAGGVKLLELCGMEPDIYHMNEGHALPLVYALYKKTGSVEEVKKKVVFTTHTPEQAGNEERPLSLLEKMSFFGDIPLETVRKISRIKGDSLNYTLTALRFSKIANGVSAMHGEVARNMWKDEGVCPIISITNAQNKKYWKDEVLESAFENGNDDLLGKRKKELKKDLFKLVADEAGKLFRTDVLTIVWARRLAGYKRAGLLFRDPERLQSLLSNPEMPVQIIWAGKPYPADQEGIHTFNFLLAATREQPHCAVLTGYELGLSATLKKGADIWLNTPRITREASGTSGMTAAMNGAINVSVLDGWVPEFAKNGHNGFYLPQTDSHLPVEEQDRIDHENLMKMLEKEVIPTYYRDTQKWQQIMKNSMQEVYPRFDSDRMAREYYEKMYRDSSD